MYTLNYVGEICKQKIRKRIKDREDHKNLASID